MNLVSNIRVFLFDQKELHFSSNNTRYKGVTALYLHVLRGGD